MKSKSAGLRINMPSISKSLIKEYIGLFWINLKTQLKNLGDFFKVAIRYYPRWSYAKVDGSLLLTYLFDNPFTISKRFLMKRGAKDVYAYGETPLATMEFIAKECGLKNTDTVFELGSGRGRTCFWLREFVGCRVVGVEYIPEFAERATRVANKLRLNKIEFRQEDFLETDFQEATVFYLYGTCYDESFIRKLIDKLKTCPSGTKIISVSYPLSDYTAGNEFEVMKRFPAEFTWGSGDVYLQVRK